MYSKVYGHCSQLEPTWPTGSQWLVLWLRSTWTSEKTKTKTHWYTLCLWSAWTLQKTIVPTDTHCSWSAENYLTNRYRIIYVVCIIDLNLSDSKYTLTHIVFVVNLNLPDRQVHTDTHCVCGQREPTWQMGTHWHILCLWSAWMYLTDGYTLTHTVFVVSLNLPDRRVHADTHCVCGQLEPTWQTGTHWHILRLWSTWTYLADRYTLTHIVFVVNLNLHDKQVHTDTHCVCGQLEAT